MNFITPLPINPYCEGPSGELGLRPYSHYSDSDSDSDSVYFPGPGHIPRPIGDSHHKLTDVRLKCDRNLGWSLDWAVASLIKHLDETSAEVTSIFKKIKLKAQAIANEGRSSDIVYRTFRHLDQAFFAGHLKDAVYLDIGSLGSDVSGATFTHGRGPNQRVRRISIILNSDVHKHASAGHILASLIHHMIHAYFLVACGPQEEKEPDYDRLSHGTHFAKVMRTIKNLTASSNCKPLQLGFGHPLHPRGYYNEYHPRPTPKKSAWYCTHCFADVDPVSEADVAEYYDTVCKPLLDLPEAVQSANVLIYSKRSELVSVPRAETTPSMDSCEFIFQEKEVVLVPNDKIDAFLSIRKAFEKSKTRYLLVPEEISRGAFMSLLELLHTGSYGPDISPVSGTGRSKGPPVIKHIISKSPPYLLTDIQMFKLGCQMGFDECKALALERMQQQNVTREDPVAVLREIYDGFDPDPEIRQWAKTFLVRGPDDGWMGSSAGGGEPVNLVKLEQGMDVRERFLELVEGRAALQIDVLRAKEYLVGIMGRARGFPGMMGGGMMLPFGMGMGMNMGVGMGMGMGMGGGQARFLMDGMGQMGGRGVGDGDGMGMDVALRRGLGYGGNDNFGGGWLQ
ncbi:SprT-like family-domain-containing protein [Dendryphion nanum]|uniref:SprT-like family-domain-containing protein n=1 Tax=Dendryphion nanum TaxID=256645 RepID=A0A9P9EL59_9PLEO|nr:SprT-like family-domain-containing protein [Dendryphion nanum]